MVANKEFPTGIDFEEKKLVTKKVGKNLRKLYIWRFDTITAVIEGKTTQKDILNSLREFNWLNGTNNKILDLVSKERATESTSIDLSEDTDNPDREFESFDSSRDDYSSSEDENSEILNEFGPQKLRYSDIEITSEDE